MATNRGKKFEQIIKQSFEKVPNVSVDRLHDQTTGYAGSKNICDFIVYKKPYEYYIECKTIHGNTFPLSNITDNQFNGLLQKAKIFGVIAGIIIWWVDKNVTKFIPIQFISLIKNNNCKSIRYDSTLPAFEIKGKKKRVFFNYDMKSFLQEVEQEYKNGRW